MNLGYLVLLITLKNINCYISSHQTVLPHSKNLKNNPEPVTPARYKIVSSKNYDTVSMDYFPEVEHPSSVIDSSKPFYITSSPFSDDVTSSFKSLSEKNNKAPSSIDYVWRQNEKLKEVPANDKKRNVTIDKENSRLKLEEENVESQRQVTDNHIDEQLKTVSSIEQSIEYIECVIELNNDLEELMKNITSIVSKENTEDKDSSVNINEGECADEFTSVSVITPNNNDSVTEFNINSFPIEDNEPIQNPLFEESDANAGLFNITSILNEDTGNDRITEILDDMQADFCSIEAVSKEKNVSCTEH